MDNRSLFTEIEKRILSSRKFSISLESFRSIRAERQPRDFALEMFSRGRRINGKVVDLKFRCPRTRSSRDPWISVHSRQYRAPFHERRQIISRCVPGEIQSRGSGCLATAIFQIKQIPVRTPQSRYAFFHSYAHHRLVLVGLPRG